MVRKVQCDVSFSKGGKVTVEFQEYTGISKGKRRDAYPQSYELIWSRSMNKWKMCFVAGTFTLLVGFVVAQSPEIDQPNSPQVAHKVTLNLSHLTERGFRLSAFVETGSTADVCHAAYSTTNQPEVLMPISCTPTEYRGKHGIRLLSCLWAYPRDNFEVTVSIYQPYAQYYGAPVLYDIPKQ